MTKQKVLIVGGGFGGIKAALELSKDGLDYYKVTLLSDQPNWRYYPSVYRTATGGAPAGSSIPLNALLDEKEVDIIQGSAQTLDKKARTLTLADGTVLNYDILVLGLGVVTNYFGIPGMQEFSYSIKSLEEIWRFQDHLHQQLIDDREPDLNYVIVGGGPTGIELAGALPEYLKKISINHGVKLKALHIDLIESAPRLLPRMPKHTSKMVAKRLRQVGVKLYAGQAVQGVAVDQLTVNGKPMRSHTVIWTAGVTNHPFFQNNGFTIMPNRKVATDVYLAADQNIYVIGDNANTPYSGMAQTALLDGEFVAANLIRKAKERDPEGYTVKKPITVIPVGERWATVLWGKVTLNGVIGWVLRELADLIAFADYEPWWKAGKQWLTGMQEAEMCEVCRMAEQKRKIDK